jgi:hypothetical protein
MNKIFFRHHKQHHLHPASLPPPQNSSNSTPLVYTSPPPYAEHQNYLQMLGAYLTPTATGYKCVDPYFLSQGKFYFELLFIFDF